MKTASQTIKLEHKKIVKMLSAFLLLTFLLYGYFIFKSISNVLVRQELHNQSVVLGSDLGLLEANYLALKDSIDVEYAYALGFVNEGAKYYVEKSSVVSVRQGGNTGR